ncbi:MAG: hypothetical protein FWC87_07235, partial [Acidimicrobiaceae bacterium]|nr:hypothetical protein [Acidimicrobiaceae bacterium]
MARRVGIDLMTFFGIEVSCLQHAGAEPERLVVRGSWIFDMEVQMYLLGRPVRPGGRDMVGCELDADVPLARGAEDATKLVIAEDVAAKD